MKTTFPKKNITTLLQIKYPIIQAGMVWVSGAKLAAAAANAGILGVIGAGSMAPELLKLQIKKAQSLTNKPLAVNIPLLYHNVAEQIDIALSAGINIFITSAGSPKIWTGILKENKASVIHVTSSPQLAIKCAAAGVDALIAEGFEAGGHNGRDELTTMTLLPQVVDAVGIPVIAAGGIGDGRGIAAAFALGAQGVQMGTRFLMCQESSAHNHFKQAVLAAKPGDTKLLLKSVVPVRLLNNAFSQRVQVMENNCSPKEEILAFLGKGRAKKGMLLGDLVEGELEVGQIGALLQEIPSVKECVQSLLTEYQQVIKSLT